MEFEIVKLKKFSGAKATIYSIIIDNENTTLFDKFIKENNTQYPNEIKNIINKLYLLGNEYGLRDNFFKLSEGNLGDGVCALYDAHKTLRLYGIKYGTVVLILGSGGIKPKNTRSLQETQKLKDENYLLREISKIIIQLFKDGEIGWSEDGLELKGNLYFNDNL